MLSLDDAIASLEGGKPPPVLESFASVLHKCRIERHLHSALHLHTYMHRTGLDCHKVLGNYLVCLLVDVGCIGHAKQVFDRLAYRNECAWNSLMSGYAECGEPDHALMLYYKIRESTVSCSKYIFVTLLKACVKLKDAAIGRTLHADIARTMLLEDDLFIGSALTDMYIKCGLLVEAQEVFDNLPIKGVVSWTALISGYARDGHGEEALKCFQAMKEEGIHPDEVTLIHALKACALTEEIEKGSEIHTELVRQGLEMGRHVGSTLVDMYASCGWLTEAWEFFRKLSDRDVVTWTALIVGYANQDQGEEALHVLEQMQIEKVSPNAVTYVCCLKICSRIGAIEKGLGLHFEICRQGLLEKECHVGNGLISMYAKCGLLGKAEEVFDSLCARDEVSWNALIAGYVGFGCHEEALTIFEKMKLEGIPTKAATFVCILKACSSIKAIDQGQAIHTEISKRELLESDLLVRSSLIDMYANCGLLEKARGLLESSLVRDAVSWTALLAGYLEHGFAEASLNCLKQMQSEGILPNAVTYGCSLRACGSIKATEVGRGLHVDILKRGLLDGGDIVSTALVDFYSKSGLTLEAHDIFGSILVRDIFCWNALIGGLSEQEYNEEALSCFEQMQLEGVCPNGATFTYVVKACNTEGAMSKAQELHTKILEAGCLSTDHPVGIALIGMYVKFGLLDKAKEVCDKLPIKDAVAWNALMAGYIDNEHGEEALTCFENMVSEGITQDAVSYIWVLKACGSLRALEKADELHDVLCRNGVLKTDLAVGNTLVDMYAKLGMLAKAQAVFDQLPRRDIVSWNVLISGYLKHGFYEQTHICYDRMLVERVHPNIVTFISCLKACGFLGIVDRGQEIHLEIARQGLLEREVELGVALVNMYVKVGLFEKAQGVITILVNKYPPSFKHIGLWNSLIAGYEESGCHEDTLTCFERIQHGGALADAITFVYVLKACGSLSLTNKGTELHAEVARKGLLDQDFVLCNALIDMYSKCGSMTKAQEVFGNIYCPDTVAWTTMILGFAQVGESGSVFKLFDRMRAEDQHPNAITLVGILTACSHDGLVDEGQMCFEGLKEIIPSLEHHTCVVDGFGRAGQLEKALHMIEKMPFHPSLVVWQTLLAASQKWGNVGLAGQAFEYAAMLGGESASTFVFMSNIYASGDLLQEE